jgi:hypothetical protein
MAKPISDIFHNEMTHHEVAQRSGVGEAFRRELARAQKPKNGGFEAELHGAQRDAFVAINDLFESYGLKSLAPKIYSYIKNGYSGDTISLLLQKTPEYKQRFSGNEIRLKAGLPVLSAAEYLSTEASFRQIMSSAGLPSGFYDQPGDFATWIGKGVSPTEIQSRVDLATQATTLSNPSYRQALNQMGIDDSQLTAYFLDPTKAMPALQKSAATAAIGSEALQRGLVFNQSDAEKLATSGVTQAQAAQGYSQIGQSLSQFQDLNKIYGGNFTQQQAEAATFLGDKAALQEEKRLAGREAAAFGGSTGTGANALANNTQAR